ncbi:MAG: DUF1573 domain-containing protein [Ignavibacteriaceae bacterium]|nr:DUF1573 domain-containing protein [Ignavibacteriaceae bacterium]
MIKSILMILFTVASITFAQLVAPKASVSDEEFDFGNIEQGKIVEHNFVLVNTGGDLLKISNVRATCGCTAAKPDKSELKPGESTSIKVTFNSAGRMGQQQKFVYLSTNDPANSELMLKIKGNVISAINSTEEVKKPRIFLPEINHNFGKVKEGAVVSHVFKIVNKGKATLEILEVKTSCGCTAALLNNKKIEPGKEGTLKVDLDTKNRSGQLSRTITILSNDSEQQNRVLTISAEIIKAGN